MLRIIRTNSKQYEQLQYCKDDNFSSDALSIFTAGWFWLPKLNNCTNNPSIDWSSEQGVCRIVEGNIGEG